MFYQPAALDIAVLILAVCILSYFVQQRRRASLPPGPLGLPIIGNLLDMPSSQEWLTFAEWRQKWGDLIYLNLLGKPIVVINNPRHANALLDKRSALYSDRPDMLVAGHIIGWNEMLILLPYDIRFRAMRRMFIQTMGNKSNLDHLLPLVERVQSKLMVRLWRDPERARVNPERHSRLSAATASLQLAYGYEVKEENDDLVRINDDAMNVFGDTTTPAAFLLDAFPFLLHLPSWFPGAGWKKNIPAWQKGRQDMVNLPFQYAKEQLAAGNMSHNLAGTHLQTASNPEEEELVKQAAAAIYAGGADTSISTTGTFFLAMMLHPEIQKRAQAEIDVVVGRDRLPTYADRERLPYLEAVWKELLRWQPVAPQGVMHTLKEDDVYDGYVFRKGTTFIANIWAFVHDPEIYKDPITFNPDRFLKGGIDGVSEPEPHPATYVFGFGRRICPGQVLAEVSTYITCILALTLFNVTPAEGEPAIDPASIKYSSGTISQPPPFKCCVEPRTKEAEMFLEEMEANMQG